MDAPSCRLVASPSFSLIIVSNKDASYLFFVELGLEVVRHKNVEHTSKDHEMAYNRLVFFLPNLVWLILGMQYALTYLCNMSVLHFGYISLLWGVGTCQ